MRIRFRGVLDKGGLVVLLLTAMAGGCTVSPIAYDDSAARGAAEAFMEALTNRDYQRAYDLLASETKQHTTLASFRASREGAERDGRGVVGYEVGLPVPLPGASPQSALQAPVAMEYEDGDRSTMGLVVVNEGESGWRIHFSGPPNSAADPG